MTLILPAAYNVGLSLVKDKVLPGDQPAATKQLVVLG